MSVTQFDPLGLRFFEDAVTRLMSEPRTNRPWSPAVDISETEDALILHADLPGVEMKNIDIRLENETLTIQGQRSFEKDDQAKGYHRIERQYGNFVRAFSVPATIEVDKVSAEYRNGVLAVTLPKKEAAKPRQVKVEVK